MDFFEFLFGKKEDKNVSSQSSSSVNNCKSESTIKSVLQSEAPSMDPIEQYVKESVTDLKKHMPLNTKDLEAEAIYLAAYLYLKGSYQIDFELDYFSEGFRDHHSVSDQHTQQGHYKSDSPVLIFDTYSWQPRSPRRWCQCRSYCRR